MEKMNRRKFIGTTVAGTVAMTTMLRGASNNAVKPKLKTGLIGCGWYGMADRKDPCVFTLAFGKLCRRLVHIEKGQCYAGKRNTHAHCPQGAANAKGKRD